MHQKFSFNTVAKEVVIRSKGHSLDTNNSLIGFGMLRLNLHKKPSNFISTPKYCREI